MPIDETKGDEIPSIETLKRNWKYFNEKERASAVSSFIDHWKKGTKPDKDKILKTLREFWGHFNYPEKDRILNMLEESWESLEESENNEKKHLWSSLSEIQKAELLEFFSRKYTMAHAVFAARNIIKEKCKEKYKYKDVYIQLEDPDKSLIEEWKNKGTVGTVIINDQSLKPDILSCKIYYYSKNAEMASYDKGYISKKSKRFVICHEIAHIILHIQDIIEDNIKKVCIFPSDKRSNSNEEDEKRKEEEKRKEYEADIFAEMLSDLRDRRVLMRLLKRRESQVKSKIDLCEEYRNRKIEDERFKSIMDEAINLSDLSENHTVSNAIFAIKKIISAYEIKNKPSNTTDSRKKQAEKLIQEAKEKRNEWSHGIQVYPFKRNEQRNESMLPENNVVSIVTFDSVDGGNTIGYNIAPSKQEKPKDTEDIAKALGVLSLCYEKIKEMLNASANKKTQILVNKTSFPRDFDKFEAFSKDLIKARDVSVKSVVETIKCGSGERILINHAP